MADAVATQVLENGSQYYRAKFTNLSDGTGESGVTKVDPTSSGDMGVVIQGNTLYPGTHLKLVEMEYTVTGMTLQIDWDATSDVTMWLLQGYGKFNYRKRGSLFVPQSGGAPVTGATGKVLFTTKGAGAGSSYTVEMTFKKDIVQ
jgi:hypothetical protein